MSLTAVDRLVLGGAVAVCGVFVGVTATFHHRSLPPWGVIAVLVVVAMWVVGLRLVSESRGLPLIGVLAVLGAQLVLSVGSERSVVVAAGPLGWIFTVGVVLICLVILAWPDLRKGPRRYDEDSFLEGRTLAP